MIEKTELEKRMLELMYEELSHFRLKTIRMSRDLKEMGLDPDASNDYQELRLALNKFRSLVGMYLGEYIERDAKNASEKLSDLWGGSFK